MLLRICSHAGLLPVPVPAHNPQKALSTPQLDLTVRLTEETRDDVNDVHVHYQWNSACTSITDLAGHYSLYYIEIFIRIVLERGLKLLQTSL